METGKVYMSNEHGVMLLGRVLGEYQGGPMLDKAIRHHGDFLRIDTESLHINRGWCLESNFRTCREATSEEIMWLDECIKQKKYIPKEIIQRYYEIY